MIRELRLQSFKNFKDATLSLGHLSVLVGANASGKSNLRDAFRFLHGMARGYTLAEILGEKYIEGELQWRGIRGGLREIAYRGASSFVLETKLSTLTVPSETLTHTIQVSIGANGGSPRVVREALLCESGTAVYDSHPKDNPPKQEGPPYLFVQFGGDQSGPGKRIRFLDNQPILTQLRKHPEVQKCEDPNTGSRIGLVINYLHRMRFLDLQPNKLRIPSLPGQVELGGQGENLSSVLQAIWENKGRKEATLEWIRQLTPLDVIDFEFVADQTGKILVTLVESNGQRTSAYSASDGTLRFLALIAAMLGPDPVRFYFIEELDNGIHPARQWLLLQLIEQSVAAGKIQVVGTTHSPQLLAFLNPESQEAASLVYRLPKQPDAHVRRILDLPDARSVLRECDLNLGRLLESGWMENVVDFEAPSEPALEAAS